MARALGASLLLLRVVDVRAGFRSIADPIDTRLATAEARAELARLAGGLETQGLEVSVDVGVGDPATEILRVSEATGADMVVLGPNRETPSQGALGSTALKVLNRSGPSIFLVRPRAATEGKTSRGPVLAAVDGSPSGDWSAFQAAVIARARGVDLVLAFAHVEPELFGAPSSGPACDCATGLRKANRAAARDHLTRLEAQLRGPGLTVRSALATGRSAREALDRLADAEGADLTVLGACGAQFRPDRGRGPVARALLLSGRTSVLVCQHAPRLTRRPALESSPAVRPDRLRPARAQ